MTAQVALDFFPQKVSEAQFISYPDGIVILYQAQQYNRIVQYVARLDGQALLIGKPIAIDSVKTGWFGGNKHFYSSVFSEDKSKIMIFGLGKNKLTTILLTDQLQVLNRGQFDLEKKDADFSFDQTLLDNSGEFYMMAGRENGSRNYSNLFRIYYLSPDGTHLSTRELPLEDKYLSGTLCKLNFNNHDLYSAAFYSSRKSGNLEGIYYFVFNPATGIFTTQKTIPFQDQVILDADVRNKKKALNDFEVRKLIIKIMVAFC
jgi:hypothetical protein